MAATKPPKGGKDAPDEPPPQPPNSPVSPPSSSTDTDTGSEKGDAKKPNKPGNKTRNGTKATDSPESNNQGNKTKKALPKKKQKTTQNNARTSYTVGSEAGDDGSQLTKAKPSLKGQKNDEGKEPKNPELGIARTYNRVSEDIHPNGRVKGRKLVMWHRARMVEKLLFHLQYESHRAGIELPWDKAVQRLCPGSSGSTATQYLNKLRDHLIEEGHLVPPLPGRIGRPDINQNIRGYIRDMSITDEIKTRVVPWDEPVEDRMHSLSSETDSLRGSGNYRRTAKFKAQTQARRAAARSQRGRRQPKSEQSQSIKKEDSGDEVDPLDLDSDDDYNPSVRIPKSRPRKKRSSIKIADIIDHESDVMPHESEGEELQKMADHNTGDSCNITLNLSPEALSQFPAGEGATRSMSYPASTLDDYGTLTETLSTDDSMISGYSRQTYFGDEQQGDTIVPASYVNNSDMFNGMEQFGEGDDEIFNTMEQFGEGDDQQFWDNSFGEDIDQANPDLGRGGGGFVNPMELHRQSFGPSASGFESYVNGSFSSFMNPNPGPQSSIDGSLQSAMTPNPGPQSGGNGSFLSGLSANDQFSAYTSTQFPIGMQLSTYQPLNRQHVHRRSLNRLGMPINPANFVTFPGEPVMENSFSSTSNASQTGDRMNAPDNSIQSQGSAQSMELLNGASQVQQMALPSFGEGFGGLTEDRNHFEPPRQAAQWRDTGNPYRGGFQYQNGNQNYVERQNELQSQNGIFENSEHFLDGSDYQPFDNDDSV